MFRKHDCYRGEYSQERAGRNWYDIGESQSGNKQCAVGAKFSSRDARVFETLTVGEKKAPTRIGVRRGFGKS